MTKRTLFLLLLFFCFSISAFSQVDSTAIQFAQTIKAEDLSNYLHVLASDSMQGRETGTIGQKRAAQYIKGKFQEFGLRPIIPTDSSSSYFQDFSLVKKTWDEVYLKLGKQKETFLKDFYAYGNFDIPTEKKFKVVFAGFGIDCKQYSDYEGLNVAGKGVVLFMGEPRKDGKSLISGETTPSEWAFDWKKKASTAQKKGALAVFIVVGDNYDQFEAKLTALQHYLSQPTLSFTYKEQEGSAFFIPPTLAAEILKTSTQNLREKVADLGVLKPANFHFKSAQIAAKVTVKKSALHTTNVLGFLEGTDKKEEVIAITAHYDHLGMHHGKIFYGADDNGSGTSGLLEMAQAFSMAKKAGKGTKRSILFISMTGEEEGLLGSEYYTDNPVIPLNQIVTDLNIDMIGRVDTMHKDNPNYVYLIGDDRLSSTLHRISEKTASVYMPGFKLDYTYNAKDDPNRFYYRSDHYNFAKNNIPVIFYFSGVHADYHRPTDTVDKINFTKAAKISRLVFYTAWELANLEKPIEVDVKQE